MPFLQQGTRQPFGPSVPAICNSLGADKVVSDVAIFCLGIFVSGFVASVGLLILTCGILNGPGQTFYYPSESPPARPCEVLGKRLKYLSVEVGG